MGCWTRSQKHQWNGTTTPRTRPSPSTGDTDQETEERTGDRTSPPRAAPSTPSFLLHPPFLRRLVSFLFVLSRGLPPVGKPLSYWVWVCPRLPRPFLGRDLSLQS